MASYNFVTKLYKTNKKIFTTLDIENYLDIHNKRTLENSIKKLIDEKVLTTLEKGKYYVTDNPPETFEIAQYLYSPSYISLESALNYYGMLSQFPYEITSVTLKKRVDKEVEGKIYTYSKLSKKYFLGYVKVDNYLIAEREKALFDMVYMISKSYKPESILNNLNYELLDFKEFMKYTKLLNDKQRNQFNKYLDQYK